ncbi:hypothetical protein LWI28_018603 [Acer negundo]|uniref:Uncharacterized protein n=1 Tax=Acer negundo TaxID=4023 RepID=A0AAD5IMY0_ACENE|nr:hypothetical protein LWI28_018603 [Acer negundo]
MDNIFKISVLHGTNVIDLGECDGDHISLITLVHAMNEHINGSSKVLSEEYSVWVQLPWCSDIVERSPNNIVEEPGVVEQIGWCDAEAGMFDYVVFSDGEGIDFGCDEKADDNRHFVGLDGDNGDGLSLDGDNEDGLGLDGDYGDEENNDYRDCVGVESDNEDGVGLDGGYRDGDNRHDVGLDGDYGDITNE